MQIVVGPAECKDVETMRLLMVSMT